MPRFDNLPDWLDWQSTLHPQSVELGLARIRRVAEKLDLLQPACPVVMVAGTNGKGSSVAMLEAILAAAGYRVACYSSPHLLRYNERIRIGGDIVADASICSAFASIDENRQGTSLTYFEFGTLAALLCFREQPVDVMLLEVGLGGRLDAVNIIDADVALVTAIDIDHREWLGDTRESIGYEKAGIFRAHRPAICSDPSPPASVRGQARAIAADWYAPGDGYDWQAREDSWDWFSDTTKRPSLPLPSLAGRHQLQNAAGVLMAIDCLATVLPVEPDAVVRGLQQASLPGRFQTLDGPVETLVDVAHNPASLAALATLLLQRPSRGRTHVVLGMLQDKDVAAGIAALSPAVDCWYLAGLEPPRGLPAASLQDTLSAAIPGTPSRGFATVADALHAARAAAGEDDRIVVTGSFITVAQALATRV